MAICGSGASQKAPDALPGLEYFQNGAEIGRILQKKIRRMGCQFRGGVFTRGDGQGARADRARASDVMRRIAEDEDAFRREFEAVPLLGAGAGEGAERISVVMIVRERAKFEIMPDPIMGELELGSALQIAGKESEDDVFALPEGIEKGQHARQKRAFLNREFEREVMQITIEKLREVFGGGRESVRGEHLPGDSRIGAARDLHRGEIIVDPETIPKAQPERFFAGAAGSEERAVDIEKEQFFVQAPRVSARTGRAQAQPVAGGGFRRGQRGHVLCSCGWRS